MQQGGGNILGMGGTVVARGDVGRNGDDDDEKDSNKNKYFSPKDKWHEKEKSMEDEEEEDVQIIASTKKVTHKPSQNTTTSISRVGASPHSLI